MQSPAARRLPGRLCNLRPWRTSDGPALVKHANDPLVAAWMRDRFPHPYKKADARAWLDLTVREAEATNWAIEVDGAAAGGIGLVPQSDINAGTAEIGYWLGKSVWGRGIATEATTILTRHALDVLGFRRLFATAFAENFASQRVLEKSGYELEGRLRRSAIKSGVVYDQLLYAIVTVH